MSTFHPSPRELLETDDLFVSLIKQGRRIVKEENSTVKSIREMQEANSARNLAAAQRIMDRFQWRPKACIALVHTYHCATCGHEHSMFAGFGISMYRQADKSERILMCGSPDEGYPKETRYTRSATHSCMNCITNQGYPHEKESHGRDTRELVSAA